MTHAHSFICKGVSTFLSDTANAEFLQNSPSYAFDTKKITGSSTNIKTSTATTLFDPITGEPIGGGTGNNPGTSPTSGSGTTSGTPTTLKPAPSPLIA